MEAQSSSSTLPLPPARSQTISAFVHSYTLHRARSPRVQNWRRVLTIVAVVAFVVVLASLLGIFLTMRKKNTTTTTTHDCKVFFTVSESEADFRTISEAVDASPNNSPFNVCISIRTGEYNEVVQIGAEKTNLILLGEGRDQTSITSNASFDDGGYRASTLRVDGTGFMAKDLSIINTANIGVAVDNSATNSIFFRCRFVGKYRALHVKKHKQFYRDCILHGGNHLISGDASAFFQRCQFLSENLYHEKDIIFSGHSSEVSDFKTNLIFHLCEFRVVGGLPAQNVFLGNAIGNGCSIVVMQCYLDEYLTGYFVENPAWNNISFAVFDNNGPGATKIIPPFVHALDHAEASNFSLRSFFNKGEWKPSNRVDCDLDLA